MLPKNKIPDNSLLKQKILTNDNNMVSDIAILSKFLCYYLPEDNYGIDQTKTFKYKVLPKSLKLKINEIRIHIKRSIIDGVYFNTIYKNKSGGYVIDLYIRELKHINLRTEIKRVLKPIYRSQKEKITDEYLKAIKNIKNKIKNNLAFNKFLDAWLNNKPSFDFSLFDNVNEYHLGVFFESLEEIKAGNVDFNRNIPYLEITKAKIIKYQKIFKNRKDGRI